MTDISESKIFIHIGIIDFSESELKFQSGFEIYKNKYFLKSVRIFISVLLIESCRFLFSFNCFIKIRGICGILAYRQAGVDNKNLFADLRYLRNFEIY